VANRRISEFPEIGGAEIDESDLLDLVHVFEVDPVLRNKKITFSGFKDYLSQYYSPISGGSTEGNLVILGNLTVSGSTNLTTLNCSSLSVFSSIIVQNNATVVNTFSGATITGTAGNYTSTQAVTGVFTAELSGAAITGNTANFTTLTGAAGNFTSELTAETITGTTAKLTTITGISGVFTSQLSGATITGDVAQLSSITGISGVFTSKLSGETVTGTTANFTTGNFDTLITSGHTVTGDATVSGDLYVNGSGYFSSGVEVTGTFSGTTITGASGQFTDITGITINTSTLTGVSGIFTSQFSGAVITGDTTRVTTLTGISGVFTSQVSGAVVTGNTLLATNVTGTSATFTTSVSGAIVTGDTGNFTNLNATNITGSTLAVTTPSGATPAIVCSGVVSGGTGGFVIQGPLVILP